MKFVIRMASAARGRSARHRASATRRCGSRASLDDAAHRDAGHSAGGADALPLGLLAARTLNAPRPVFWVAKGVLDVMRSIHTLVFGLFFSGHRGPWRDGQDTRGRGTFSGHPGQAAGGSDRNARHAAG